MCTNVYKCACMCVRVKEISVFFVVTEKGELGFLCVSLEDAGRRRRA
jgi:hypothetical protein